MSHHDHGHNRRAPKVHIPPFLANPIFEPQSALHQQASPAPPMWTYGNRAYSPSSPVERPHVQLPVGPSSSGSAFPLTRSGFSGSQSHGGDAQHDFENQLRGLIIRNEAAQAPASSASTPNTLPDLRDTAESRTPYLRKRPNQAQRRQQAQSMWKEPVPTQGQLNSANIAPQQISANPRLIPVDLPKDRRFDLPHTHRNLDKRMKAPFDVNQKLHAPPRQALPKIQAYANGPPLPYHRPNVQVQVQVDYLDHLAYEEVSKVQISNDELEEKQALRQKLETVCRQTIADVEKATDHKFERETVELKSFGSLSIGFATKDSDMDLVLLSPSSAPPLSSPASPIPRLVEKALMDLGYGVRLLTQTRVPIIKFCEKPDAILAGCLRMARLHWEDDIERRAIQLSKEAARPSHTHKKQAEHSRPVSAVIGQAAVTEALSPAESNLQDSLDPPYPAQHLAEIPDLRDTEAIMDDPRAAADDLLSLTVTSKDDNSKREEADINETDEFSRTLASNARPDLVLYRKTVETGATASMHTETEDLNLLPTSIPQLSEQQDPKKIVTSGDILPHPKDCKRATNISNYSNFELVGICKRSLSSKNNSAAEQALMKRFIEDFEAQTHSLPHEEPGKARQDLEILGNSIKTGSMPSREELDYPKAGAGIQCDINFSNHLALQNSLLLKCYSLCDPRVRVVVLFVKAWTKKRKINSSYHGTLNSYGYVLMVLHFLMNVANPPVIPNLQRCSTWIEEDFESRSQIDSNGYNVRFFRNESKIKQMAELGQLTQNRDSVGALLRGFFSYFAQPPINGFRWKDDVLSLRTPGGILTKVSKGWVGARSEIVDLGGPGLGPKKVNHHYVVAIEDPFETEHNVARTVFFNGIVAIRDEFRRAVALITFAGIDPQNGPQDFFAEGAKNENLQKGSNRPGTGRASSGQKMKKETQGSVKEHQDHAEGKMKSHDANPTSR